MESSGAGVLENQIGPTTSRPSTPLPNSPLPPKKRGRPSKADIETRQAEALARGEELPSPKPSAKRARPFAGEFSTEGVATQAVSESDGRNLNPGDALLERQLLNESHSTHAEQIQSPIMAVPSPSLTSPPPFSTLMQVGEGVSSTAERAGLSSLSRKRVRIFRYSIR
jgi:hypothetical protein